MTDLPLPDLFGIDLRDKKVIVVGGGPVAVKRVRRLLSSGAVVKVIAIELSDEMFTLSHSRLCIEQRSVVEQDIIEAFLVITATDDSEVNSAVQRWAKQKGIMCNRADVGTEGDFSFSALLTPEENSFKIAMVSGDAGPVFSQWVKRRFFGEKEISEMENAWHALKIGRQVLEEKGVHGLLRKQLLELLIQFFEQKKSHPDFRLSQDEIRKFLEDYLQEPQL